MPSKMKRAICTIVIPAYNEAAVIGRTLTSLTRGARGGEFEVIVVCNGCADNTAKLAQKADPNVNVIELVQPSKTNALNVGIAAATCNQIVFLDADIQTSSEAVRMLLHRLTWSGAYLAYGTAIFKTQHCSWPVKAFYRAWQQNPYFDKKKMGGFFALSKAGLSRLGLIPETTNDDEYVRRSLECCATWAEKATYSVEAPRRITDLIKVRSRIYRGNAELEQGPTSFGVKTRKANMLIFVRRLWCQPTIWPGALVFAFTAIAAHLRNRIVPGAERNWETDTSTRSGLLGR